MTAHFLALHVSRGNDKNQINFHFLDMHSIHSQYFQIETEKKSHSTVCKTCSSSDL